MKDWHGTTSGRDLANRWGDRRKDLDSEGKKKKSFREGSHKKPLKQNFFRPGDRFHNWKAY